MSKSKKNFKEYEEINKQKFDLEDKIDTIGHEIWLKNNEKTKAAQQLRIIEDQLRSFFGRIRLEFKEDDEK